MNELKVELQKLRQKIHTNSVMRSMPINNWQLNVKQAIANLFVTHKGNKEALQYNVQFVQLEGRNDLSLIVFVSWIECNKLTGKQRLQNFHFIEYWG